MYRKTPVDTKRLEERLGTDRLEDTSSASVQAIFRERSPFAQVVELAHQRVRAQRPLQIALIAAAVLVVLAIGYVIGGGFSSSEVAAETPPGEVFITSERADLLRQQSIDLREARSRLAIAEGEAAFLRSQLTVFADEADALRLSFNEAQLELGIIVTIYEDCLDRLYPAECVEAARPAADAFLAELYAGNP